jgi:hypothetical protein
MRRFGTLLMAIGMFTGMMTGVWAWFGAGAFGIPWISGLALMKLAIGGSLGLMYVGALAKRIAGRRERSIAEHHMRPHSLDKGDPRAHDVPITSPREQHDAPGSG